MRKETEKMLLVRRFKGDLLSLKTGEQVKLVKRGRLVASSGINYFSSNRLTSIPVFLERERNASMCVLSIFTVFSFL